MDKNRFPFNMSNAFSFLYLSHVLVPNNYNHDSNINRNGDCIPNVSPITNSGIEEQLVVASAKSKLFSSPKILTLESEKIHSVYLRSHLKNAIEKLAAFAVADKKNFNFDVIYDDKRHGSYLKYKNIEIPLLFTLDENTRLGFLDNSTVESLWESRKHPTASINLDIRHVVDFGLFELDREAILTLQEKLGNFQSKKHATQYLHIIGGCKSCIVLISIDKKTMSRHKEKFNVLTKNLPCVKVKQKFKPEGSHEQNKNFISLKSLCQLPTERGMPASSSSVNRRKHRGELNSSPEDGIFGSSPETGTSGASQKYVELIRSDSSCSQSPCGSNSSLSLQCAGSESGSRSYANLNKTGIKPSASPPLSCSASYESLDTPGYMAMDQSIRVPHSDPYYSQCMIKGAQPCSSIRKGPSASSMDDEDAYLVQIRNERKRGTALQRTQMQLNPCYHTSDEVFSGNSRTGGINHQINNGNGNIPLSQLSQRCNKTDTTNSGDPHCSVECMWYDDKALFGRPSTGSTGNSSSGYSEFNESPVQTSFSTHNNQTAALPPPLYHRASVRQYPKSELVRTVSANQKPTKVLPPERPASESAAAVVSLAPVPQVPAFVYSRPRQPTPVFEEIDRMPISKIMTINDFNK